MSKKVNVVDFDEVNESFEKTSRRVNRAMKHGDKEKIRNQRRATAKRKGRC